MKYKLVPHLDREVAKGDFEWEYKYEPKGWDQAWHPSSHCTPSLNELYHFAKDQMSEDPTIEEHTIGLLKSFQVGHFWHQYLQYLILEKLEFCALTSIERRADIEWNEKGKVHRNIYPMAPTPQNVIGFRPFHYVSGSADVAPCSIPEHGDYLIDFKTMGSHDFKPNKAPAWAVEKWECQTNIYMEFFDLERALIVGILKDSPHDFKEFEFHRNQPLIDAIFEKWQLVSACLREDVEPPENEVIELPLKGPVSP